jgi:hypothetical protein
MVIMVFYWEQISFTILKRMEKKSSKIKELTAKFENRIITESIKKVPPPKPVKPARLSCYNPKGSFIVERLKRSSLGDGDLMNTIMNKTSQEYDDTIQMTRLVDVKNTILSDDENTILRNDNILSNYENNTIKSDDIPRLSYDTRLSNIDKNQSIITEIIDSEKHYLNDLLILKEDFVFPLINKYPKDSRIIFSNIESVINLSTDLLSEFYVNPIGKCFTKMVFLY